MPLQRGPEVGSAANAHSRARGSSSVKFENASDIPPASVVGTDICVIGSGAAGITLARELDGAKSRVLVLEAGGLEEPATEHESFWIEHLGLPYTSPLPTRGRS